VPFRQVKLLARGAGAPVYRIEFASSATVTLRWGQNGNLGHDFDVKRHVMLAALDQLADSRMTTGICLVVCRS
jgi:hypothetical protein